MAEQQGGQDLRGFDAFELWRQWYDANEKAWTKSIKEMTTTDSYVEAQGKMLEVFLSYQKLLREATSAQLNALNLPTRDDVGRLGEVVVGIEEKIDRLDELVDDLSQKVVSVEQQTARQMPQEMFDHLTQSLARVELKLSQLLEQEERRGGMPEAGEAAAERGQASAVAQAAPERTSARQPSIRRANRPTQSGESTG